MKANTLQQWQTFVRIGNSIDKIPRKIRRVEAERALKLASQLVEADFITSLSADDTQVYDMFLYKIAEYLIDHSEFIENAVRNCFNIKHIVDGLDHNSFAITFSRKKSGVQSGLVCTVNAGKYFVKTHQQG